MTGSFPPQLYPLIFIAGLLVIGLVVYLLLKRRALASLYVQDPLFDGPSRSFWGLIDVAVRNDFSLFRNVTVTDVLCSTGTVSPLPGKIRNSQFDLLLCDRRKMQPKCAILLMDRKQKRQKEADLLRDFCDRVDLPLLVYEQSGIRDVSSLRRDIYQATGLENPLTASEVLGDSRYPGVHESDTDSAAPQPSPETPHQCKKCGASLVLRTLKKGEHAGSKAWVCERYPECRHAVLAEAKA